jgi:hypothetical protein
MTTGRQAALVEVPSSSWDALLSQLGCADAYLLSGYVEAACVLDPGEPFLLHLEGEGGHVVLAVIVRETPEGARDVTTPYGYGGPVALGADPPRERFAELYEQWCAARGIVTSFVRFHPLLANHRDLGERCQLELLGRTVAWELAGSGELLDHLHPTHRNKVRKALKRGARVETVQSPDDLGEFATLYETTMRRLEAAPFYFFPAAYWELLATRLGDQVVRFDARVESELVASAVCLATPPWLHYHLSAVSEPGRQSGASNLLLLEAARWARERGFETFHLGGGVGGREDSLFAFKAHFDPGGLLLELYVGKAVHDVPRYLELSGASTLSYDGYFPAYRSPAPPVGSPP